MTKPVLVLHTTEGRTLDSAEAALRRKNAWSHWGFDPNTDELRTWINPGASYRPARSLRNMTGGIETNNRGKVLQIEIVGYSSLVVADTYSEEWWNRVAVAVRWICDEYDVPKTFPHRFHGQAAYGRNGAARLTNREWLAVSGIVGHQHVPENTHWDPGPMDRRLKPLLEEEPMNERQTKAVKDIQTALADAGYDLGSTGIDGDPGPVTVSAVVEALADLKLCEDETGRVEPELMRLVAAGRKLEAALEALDR